MPRLYVPGPLARNDERALPGGAARHVQVLRMQPGEEVVLFNGEGGEYGAVIDSIGRREIRVRVTTHVAIEREAGRRVTLAMGVPANERFEWLVEKATELGVAAIQPLATERSVLRLTGERAERKLDHWRAITIAACEQCGRNRIPAIHPVLAFQAWIASSRSHTEVAGGSCKLLLSLNPDASALAESVGIGNEPICMLSGPEGGLSAQEEALALQAAFAPVSLGPRVLRAETAPLAALAALLT